MLKLSRPCVAMVFVLLALFTGTAFAASSDMPRVIVLPFEVNASEDLAYLEDSLPALIVERLEAKGIEVVPPQKAIALLQENGISELDIASVRDLALLSSSSFAVYGSFSQIGEEISIDARLVEAYGIQPAKALYIEKSGLINILPAVDELVAKVNNELLRKKSIAKVTIRGANVLDPDVVLTRLRTRKGDSLDIAAINDEIKRIFKLGYFSDVRASTEQTRDGVELIFTVEEKPRIEKVSIEGLDHFDEDDLLAVMSSKTGSVLNEKHLVDDLDKIKNMYSSEGYYLAKISHRVESGSRQSANLVLTVDEGEKLYIKEIKLLGVEQLDPDDVRDELALSTRNLLSWFTEAGLMREDYLQRDAAAIGAYYRNRGFMDVGIAEPQVEFEEDGIIITFRVKEGKPYKIGDIEFAGDLIESDEELLKVTKIDELKEEGENINYSVLTDDKNALTDLYTRHGYAYASVGFKTQRSGDVAHLTYTITKKAKIYVRRVTLEGNTRTRDNVIRREMLLTDGELFQGNLLAESSEELNNLGFFETAEVDFVPTDKENEVDLKVKVKEKNTGSLMAGLGWSTNNGVGISGGITEDNLWGRGYTGQLSGTFSGSQNRYNLAFINPRLNDSKLGFRVDSYITEKEYLDYSAESVGGGLAFFYPLTNKTTLRWGYRAKHYTIKDVDEDADKTIKDQEGDRIASIVAVTLTRNGIKKAEGHPVSGVYTSLTAEYGGGVLMGDDDFVKFVGTAKAFYALNNDHVLQAHATGSALFKNGDDELPLVERFRMGGIDTVRGFEKDDFAIVEVPSGDKFGGNRSIYGGLEYQWYFEKELGLTLVPFVDAGLLWEEKNDSDLTGFEDQDLLASAGVELRWRSPLGDLRFALAKPLTKVDGEAKGPRFEFAMGQKF